jgi:hypothetical protein
MRRAVDHQPGARHHNHVEQNQKDHGMARNVHGIAQRGSRHFQQGSGNQAHARRPGAAGQDIAFNPQQRAEKHNQHQEYEQEPLAVVKEEMALQGAPCRESAAFRQPWIPGCHFEIAE